MRPAPGLGDSCLMCGINRAEVLNIVGGDVGGRRVFDTVCDTDMSKDWPAAFAKKHEQLEAL